ncbi:Rieske (2Fe-2S) protein, partial [Cellulomonas cellasea]
SLGAAALVLAACAAPADGDDEPAAGGGASADGGGSGAVLARLEDVPVGGALSVDGPDDVPLVLVQPTAGTVVAYVAVCTHQGCTVVPDRDVLVCPCHASVFSTEDGSVTTGPAEEPLGQLPVRVVDGEVLVA